ncbi:MAG: hypothetical protein FWC10_09320, partial [Lentimicrobiaceae bacterium]|nr:hypothetical protein [Lentimicrobiaceae bacterium]
MMKNKNYFFKQLLSFIAMVMFISIPLNTFGQKKSSQQLKATVAKDNTRAPNAYQIWNWEDLATVTAKLENNPSITFILMQDLGVPGQSNYGDGSGIDIALQSSYPGNKRFGWYGYEGFTGSNVSTPYNSVNVLVVDATAATEYLSWPATITACGWEGSAGWIPLNKNSNTAPSTFEGNNKVISGLWINRNTETHIGLFGSLYRFTIRNLGINIGNNKVIGMSYIGGLAGRLNEGTIENCFVTGSIKASDNFIGGLVGNVFSESENSLTNVSNCYANCFINTDLDLYGYCESLGGLIGVVGWPEPGVDNGQTVVSNCYVTGDISGVSIVGGLIGQLTNTSIMQNCYAAQNIFSN